MLRHDFTTESDIDILVEFEPGKTPGLAIIRIEDELIVLGRGVDLRTPKDLSRYFRLLRVLQEAMVIYEQS